MTILVTGGAGYIGSHMAHALVDAGEDVVVLDNLTTGFRNCIPRTAKFIKGNVGDAKLLEKLFAAHNIEAIVHFAASIVVPESVADPLKYYGNNTANTRTLIEAAVNAGVKHIIFSSTAAVYGNAEVQPVTEHSPTLPESPYGRSKLMSEWMLADAAAAHGFTYTVLRYFNVAGADPRGRVGQSTPEATHLIKVACQAALGQRPNLSVFGSDYPTSDGTCVRDYIHVSDLIAAHVAALKRLRTGAPSVTVNCGYGRGFSVMEVIKTVKKVTKIDFPVVMSPRRAGDPASIVASATTAREVLGWVPQFDDLKTIVKHAYKWEAKLAKRRAQG